MNILASVESTPLRDHCRRVAAVAAEIGKQLRLTPDELGALEAQAASHHAPRSGIDRLAADLGLSVRPVPALVKRAAPRERLVRQVVEAADFFCERVEFLPFEFLTIEQILEEVGWMARDRSFDPAIAGAMAGLQHATLDDVLAVVRRLPVYPAVALRAMRMAGDQSSSIGAIESLVSSDQVLAATVLKAANSSLYRPAREVTNLGQAVAFLGLDATARLAAAAAFRPLFASSDLRAMWLHSLAMAQRCESLATRGAQPSEAFLAGLVHDIGRLAVRLLPRDDLAAYTRMTERGCEPVIAELLLFGADHGAIGSEILRQWAFPDQFVEAVLHHHQPERSTTALASLVYAAEYLCGSEEDVASLARLRHAWDRIGAPAEPVQESGVGILACAV